MKGRAPTHGHGRGGGSLNRVHIVAVVLLALVTYANALWNDFALDDAYLIVDNERVHSLRNIPSLFATDLFDGATPAGMYYRPLVSLTFALEFAFAGDLPFVYHLTNVALHALSCALVYSLVLMLFAAPAVALVTAAVFAVHPVHTEAVTAISGRSDLLCAFFLLLAATLHAGGASGLSAGRRRAATVVCYGLALLAKESALLGLALFPLIDLVRLPTRRNIVSDVGRILRQQAGFLLACFAVTGLFLWVRQGVVGDTPVAALQFMGHPHNAAAPIAAKFATCSRILAVYYRLIVFPLALSADYSYDQIPIAVEPLEWEGTAAVLLTLALVAVASRSFARLPAITFGLLILIAGILPLAYALPFFRIVVAERYLYLPSLGFCLLLGFGVASLHQRTGRKLWAVILALLVLAPALIRTVVRNRDWRDDDTLFARTVMTSPRSARAHANRAITLLRNAEAQRAQGGEESIRERQRQACAHYEHSIGIEPGIAAVRMQHGVCLATLGSYDRAEAELLVATQLGSAEAWLYLYRAQLDQARLYAESEPERARAFLSKARSLVRERIGPRVSPGDLGQLRRELRAAERELLARPPEPPGSQADTGEAQQRNDASQGDAP